MRLIDADDVIETISHYLGKALYASYPNDKMPEFDKGMIDGYARARSIVFETPTVDPVKHGRWIEQEQGDWRFSKEFRCSECGKYRLVTNPAGWEWNFCPHCGAKMDEVEE